MASSTSSLVPAARCRPRLARFTGRELSRFVLPSGADYNPFEEYREFLLVLPARQFRLTQELDDGLTLAYVGDESVDATEALVGLRKKVFELHGRDLVVERVEGFGGGRKHHAFLRVSDQAVPGRERPYHSIQ